MLMRAAVLPRLFFRATASFVFIFILFCLPVLQRDQPTVGVIQTSHHVASAIHTGRKAKLFPRAQLQHLEGILWILSFVIFCGK